MVAVPLPSVSNATTRADIVDSCCTVARERLTPYKTRPLFFATLNPGPGKVVIRSWASQVSKTEAMQTSVGLHDHALVTPRGLEPAITGVRGQFPKPLEDGAIIANASRTFAEMPAMTSLISVALRSS